MSKFIIERADKKAGPWSFVAGKASEGASVFGLFARTKEAYHQAHSLWSASGEQRPWVRIRKEGSIRAVHLFHGGRYVHQVGTNGTDFGWVRAHH